MKISPSSSPSLARSVLDVLLVLSGKGATVLAVFIGGVIAARLGGPEAYGGFVSGITLALLLDGVLGTALDLEVVRSASTESESRQIEVQRVAFHLKWFSVALLGIVGGGIVGIYGIDTGSLPLFPALCAALGVLLARSVAVNLQIKRRFGTYSRLDAVQSLLRLATFTLVGVAGSATAAGLLYGYALVGLLVVAWGMGSGILRGVATGVPDLGESQRLLAPIGAMFLIVACGAATGRGDILVLSLVVEEATLAPYGVASQVTLLLSQLALYMSVVTQPRILADQREGRLDRLAIVNVWFFLLACLCCWIAWQSGAVEWMIVWTFGEAYLPALPLLRILILGGLADLLIVPVFMTLAVLSDRRLAAAGEGVIAVAFFVALGYVVSSASADQRLIAVAWIFVSARVAKLVLYGLLFAKLRNLCRLPQQGVRS